MPAWSRLVDTVLDRTVVLGYAAPGLAIRRRLPGWPADPVPGALTGRHVAVTGANSGLGLATAAGVAALGATVHLVVRDLTRGEAAAQRLAQDNPNAEFRLWRCDVADLDDVRRFAGEFGDSLRAGGTPLDVLIHNAGLMPPTRTESPQGFEMTMAVHVLGPVLMTDLLADRLAGGHVVFVTSGGMYAQALRADDPDYRDGAYSPTTAYARSKRMQVELTGWMLHRWGPAGITVSVTHPGWADTPGVQDSIPGFRRLTRPILRDLEEGADTAVWLAATRVPTGKLWHDRAERPTHMMRRTTPSAADVATAQRWLEASLGLGPRSV
ncbi:MAG: SDR family NAD(P)-dependent oxidoreductase [Nocardioides sp.]